MPTILAFTPPAELNDFDRIQGHSDVWSHFISAQFDSVIDLVESGYDETDPSTGTVLGHSPGVGHGRSQYYNETKTPSDNPEDVSIVWDGFPKNLTRMYGRQAALRLADVTDKSGSFLDGYLSRNQDEYCEWRVEKDNGKIVKITFTCEGPEYWASFAGGVSLYDTTFDFGPGDQTVLLDLYKTILNRQDIQSKDLFVRVNNKQYYNPYNRWNTEDGIVHLQQKNSTLGAEIRIGGDATVRRKSGGSEITDATHFICCGQFGGVNRSSDPKMGSDISAAARDGYSLTLRDPVAIYFNNFDNAGITKPGPNNTRVAAPNYWKPLRGRFSQEAATTGNMTDNHTMVVRAVYEIPQGELGPDGHQLTVGDLQIGGEPVIYGGQIAERITMKFIARKCRKGSIQNVPVDCRGRCCEKKLNNGVSLLVPVSNFSKDSCVDVFNHPIDPHAIALLASLPLEPGLAMLHASNVRPFKGRFFRSHTD